MFPPNGQKMQLLLWKHAQLNSLHLLLKLWQPKKWWFQHFSGTLLCKKNLDRPRELLHKESRQPSLLWFCWLNNIYLQHASICINMPSLPKTSSFFYLALLSKTDEFGLAAGPPLCRRAYHVRFECTWALLPKGQDSFVLRRADLNVSFWWIMGIFIKGEKWRL